LPAALPRRDGAAPVPWLITREDAMTGLRFGLSYLVAAESARSTLTEIISGL